MSSKYDEYWERRLKEIKVKIKEEIKAKENEDNSNAGLVGKIRNGINIMKGTINGAKTDHYTKEIDVSDIKKYGNRQIWSTKVKIPPGTTKITEELSPDAHGKSLGNTIINSGVLENLKKTLIGKISERGGKLFLHFEIES